MNTSTTFYVYMLLKTVKIIEYIDAIWSGNKLYLPSRIREVALRSTAIVLAYFLFYRS